MEKIVNKSKIGKQIAYLLRHDPEDLKMDEKGWVSSSQLVKKLGIKMKDLIEIVKTDDKQRYSFKNFKKKIRANQGHSISVDLELLPQEPPAILYHGTATQFLSSIWKKGISKMSRTHVHLSKDIETATGVGSRHGEIFVLEIDTKKMYDDGYKFYLSENDVWLTDNIPSKYIKK